MRNTIIGAVLAVAFIAVLFVMARMNPHAPTTETLDSLAAHIKSGYVGDQKLGDWDLSCATTAQMIGGDQKQPPAKPQKQTNSQQNQTPVPLTLNASGTTEPMAPANQDATTETTTQKPAETAAEQAKKTPATPSQPISLGRCHVTKIYRSKQNPKQAVMLVSFRLVGPQRQLAIRIIAPPAFAKKDEAIILAFGNKQGLKIPVVGCAEKQGCVAMRGVGPQQQAQLFAAAQAVLVFPQHDQGQRPQIRLPLTGLAEALTAMQRADPKA